MKQVVLVDVDSALFQYTQDHMGKITFSLNSALVNALKAHIQEMKEEGNTVEVYLFTSASYLQMVAIGSDGIQGNVFLGSTRYNAKGLLEKEGVSVAGVFVTGSAAAKDPLQYGADYIAMEERLQAGLKPKNKEYTDAAVKDDIYDLRANPTGSLDKDEKCLNFYLNDLCGGLGVTDPTYKTTLALRYLNFSDGHEKSACRVHSLYQKFNWQGEELERKFREGKGHMLAAVLESVGEFDALVVFDDKKEVIEVFEQYIKLTEKTVIAVQVHPSASDRFYLDHYANYLTQKESSVSYLVKSEPNFSDDECDHISVADSSGLFSWARDLLNKAKSSPELLIMTGFVLAYIYALYQNSQDKAAYTQDYSAQASLPSP